MTEHEFYRRFPNASKSTIAKNCPGGATLRPGNTEPTQGNALVGAAPGKETGGDGPFIGTEPRRRRSIRFTVYSLRPADWDNYSVKQLQDCLVKAGLLDGDEWDTLSGSVRSEKAHTKEEERTVVVITDL